MEVVVEDMDRERYVQSLVLPVVSCTHWGSGNMFPWMGRGGYCIVIAFYILLIFSNNRLRPLMARVAILVSGSGSCSLAQFKSDPCQGVTKHCPHLNDYCTAHLVRGCVWPVLSTSSRHWNHVDLWSPHFRQRLANCWCSIIILCWGDKWAESGLQLSTQQHSD